MSLLSGLIKKVKDEVEKKVDQLSDAVSSLKDQDAQQNSVDNAPSCGCCSCEEDSVYDSIPAEENQYNSGLSFLEYFDKVFKEEFPEYEIARKERLPGRAFVYSFVINGKTALNAEIMSEKCSANMFRKECLKNGTPYVRFYFDHEGWWNTRAYVADRTRRALNG